MRAKIGLLTILILFIPAAAVWCDDTTPAHTENADEDNDAPSMELLEFLGSWETDDGEWVDPALLDDTLSPDREYSDE